MPWRQAVIHWRSARLTRWTALVLTQLVYMPMEGLMDRGQRPTVAQAWAYIPRACGL